MMHSYGAVVGLRSLEYIPKNLGINIERIILLNCPLRNHPFNLHYDDFNIYKKMKESVSNIIKHVDNTEIIVISSGRFDTKINSENM